MVLSSVKFSPEEFVRCNDSVHGSLHSWFLKIICLINSSVLLSFRLESYVENQYKESLASVSDVDITAKLDAMCQQGQYARVLDLAKPHGTTLFNKYLSAYAAHLIKVSIMFFLNITKLYLRVVLNFLLKV